MLNFCFVFWLIKGEKDIGAKIEYIKSIDNDYKKYRSIMSENVIVDNNFIKKIDDELKLFLNNIFQQEKSKAHRIDFNFWLKLINLVNICIKIINFWLIWFFMN